VFPLVDFFTGVCDTDGAMNTDPSKQTVNLSFDALVSRATAEAELSLAIINVGNPPPSDEVRRVWIHAFKEGFKSAARARIVAV
jgi:hypothetical protein